MNHSSRTSLATGRVNQKLRTRDTLVTVAAELLRRGKQFSVADVADRARVGRTTAYRYFPTLELLMAHAALWKIARLEQNEFDHVFDRPAARERVDALVVASDRSTRLHEKEYRAMLRMSLEHAPRSEQLLPLRTAFRREALTQALAPVQKELGAKRVERLVGALCMVVGIEALIATKEVARLAPDTALGVKRWAAGALLAAALDEARRGKQKGPKRNLRRNGSALHARSLKIMR
jgi:AcrR family transcriptional regulator